MRRSNSKYVLLVLSVILCFAFCSALSAQTWQNSQLMNHSSETGLQIKAGVIYGAADGGFHCVYSAGNANVTYRRYYTSGVFTNPVIPSSGSTHNLNLATAFNGDVHIVWEDWSNTGIPIGWARSTNGGASFTRSFVPNNNTKYPYIRPFGSSGSPNMLVTCGSINYPNVSDNNLKYSTFNGSSWSPSPAAYVNPIDSEYNLHGLATSPVDNSVWKIYTAKGDRKLYIRKFNGTSWESPILIEGNNIFKCRQDIAVNVLGQVFCLWTQDDRIHVRVYDPGAGVGPLFTFPYKADLGKVVAIPNRSDFYMIFADDRTKVLGTRYFQGAFTPYERVSVNLPDGFYPDTSLAVTPDGTLYAAFEYWGNGRPQWWYSKCTYFTGPIDTTPPVFNGPVTDDGATQSIASYLHATWGAASDPESGIYAYHYSIGTSPGATNVIGWTSVGPAQEVLRSHNFAAGTYYINVRVMNNAGLLSNVVSSDGIQITAPSNPISLSAPSRVDSSGRICENVMLRKALDGGIHMVYDVSDPYVHYKKKNAVGSWEGVVGIGAGKFPDIVENLNGNVHCVFTSDGRENQNLYEAVYSNGVWSNVATIYSGNMNWYPRLADGPSGQIYLIQNSTTSHNVKFGIRTTSWPAYSSLTDLGTSGRYLLPDMAKSPDGVVHAAWVSGNNLIYRKYQSGSWTSPTTVTSASGMMLPRIAADNTGKPVITYLGSYYVNAYSIMVTRWTGSSWTTPQVVGYGHYPSVATDSSNRIHVAWSFIGTGNKEDIAHMVFNGSAWTTMNNVSANVGISLRPSIVSDVNGGIHIAWQDDSVDPKSKILYSAAPNTQTGIISGTVVDGLNNAVAGAVITTSSGGYLATTNSSGAYSIAAVPATYNITASKSGYNPQTINNVTVTAGQTITRNFTITAQQATITGTVKDNANNPIAGATVTTNTGGYSATTNANGVYTLSNIAPGTYNITASKTGYDSATNNGVVGTAGQVTTSNFTLTPQPGSITGTVKDSSNNPIVGATVSTNTGGYSTTTNSSGEYTLSNVAPGTYDVTASKSGYVSSTNSGVVVNPGASTTSNFTLTAQTGTITGTVKDSQNNAISGATVSTNTGGYTTTTNSSGVYTLTGVVVGTYNVTASKSGFVSVTNNNVSVTSGQTTTSNFTLTAVPVERVQNGTFEGGFFDTGWSSGCSGQPSRLPNPNGAWYWNNDPSMPFNTWQSTSIKRSGNNALALSFCQTAASPGKIGIVSQTIDLGSANATATFSVWSYHTNGNCPPIMAWNPGLDQNDPYTASSSGRLQWVCTDNWGQLNTWVNRTMTIQADASGFVTIMVGGAAHPGTSYGAPLYIDDVSVINIVPGTITGTVKDSSNNPISGATVSTNTGGYSTTTNSSGEYTLSNVAPGTYSVTASKTGYQSSTNSNVTVTGGQTTTSNFTLSSTPPANVVNGNMEGGFINTGWSSNCSNQTSKVPDGWGWNNDSSMPFNTWQSTSIKRSGNNAAAISFCQTAGSPGKLGVFIQNVYLGANATATLSVWAYHTDGNCPSIMCWNPGMNQGDPYVASAAGASRYQWVCTDNWGQRNMWVNRTMTIQADASGYVTIMVGGAAHPGTAYGAPLYIDDVTLQ
ncbi:MAG: carboxypeptidase-like regulatory domain-containing protein [Armatimonadota bacterium]